MIFISAMIFGSSEISLPFVFIIINGKLVEFSSISCSCACKYEIQKMLRQTVTIRMLCRKLEKGFVHGKYIILILSCFLSLMKVKIIRPDYNFNAINYSIHF